MENVSLMAEVSTVWIYTAACFLISISLSCCIIFTLYCGQTDGFGRTKVCSSPVAQPTAVSVSHDAHESTGRDVIISHGFVKYCKDMIISYIPISKCNHII